MVYREVQDRHQDIQKIERTLEELAQLFNDVGVMLDAYIGRLTQTFIRSVDVCLDRPAGRSHRPHPVDGGRRREEHQGGVCDLYRFRLRDVLTPSADWARRR